MPIGERGDHDETSSDSRVRAGRLVLPSADRGAALTAVRVALMLLTGPMGFLSTDVGGKLATLEAMQRNGGSSPDLGYWAESVDPDCSLYPMFSTQHVADARVNVTTLPILVLAFPL